MMVKFLKFCTADDSYKYWNRPNRREILINPNSVDAVETVTFDYSSGSETFVRVWLSSGEKIDIEGKSVDEVYSKLNGKETKCQSNQ